MSMLRQDIIDAIETRMQAIAEGETYYSDLGQNVAVWKRNKFASNSAPGLNIRDLADEQSVDAEDESLTRHQLTVELQIVCTGATAIEDLREMIADVETAIGLDESWGQDNVSTEPLGNEIEIDQDDVTIAGAVVRIIVHYTTVKFSEE